MSLRVVGGKFRGRILKTPKTDNTRPTTSMLREALFNICSGSVEGARFLDLYAGSGAMGIEAVSRGASFATLIERDSRAFQCIKDNVELLRIEPQVQLLKADVLKAMPRLEEPYDLIYVDPPYDQDVKRVLEMIHEHQLLAPEGELFVEQQYDAKAKFPEGPFALIESRRYGIAHLHRLRWLNLA